MKSDIYEFDGYKAYLKAWLAQSHEREGRGAKSAMARAANCQLAYISQVIHRDAHLSLEQLNGISDYLGLGEGEREFLFHLLNRERAATASLRRHFASQIAKIRQERLSLRKRISFSSELSELDRSIYYGSWHYPAIHVLTGIPECQTVSAIARKTRLSRRRVSAVLDFLVSRKLVQLKDGSYRRSRARIHLPGDSPLIARYHAGARALAMACAETMHPDSLQYSSIVSISQDDAIRIKASLIEAVEKAKEVIRESRDEALYCLALDFFELFPEVET